MLALSHVTKRFGGLTAVNDVSLHLAEGEILGVIGPNGSGKTTMFATVSGFLRPDEGEILFKGQNIVGKRASEISALGLARTFQIVQPFPELTVRENVIVGALRGGRSPLAEAQENAEEILRWTNLIHIAESRAGSLTIADRKRLEIARALATKPSVLLLDEVMAGLRPAEVDQAVELIKSIRTRGVSIIVVEHLIRAVLALAERLNVVQTLEIADRAYVIENGRIALEGSAASILENPHTRTAYLGLN